MNKTEKVAKVVMGGADSSAPPSNEKRGRGRPKGSKNKPKVEGVENSVPSSMQNNEIQEPGFWEHVSNFTYVRDENSIIASAVMGATVWAIVAPMFKMRNLSQDEGMRLGEALDPILAKYVPAFASWKYEINLIVVIVGLVNVCRIKEVEKAEEVNEEG